MKLTIRIERGDGQFTVAQAEIPEEPPRSLVEVRMLEQKVLGGFGDAYRRCADLPG
jgi:hypothetical protein